MMRFNKSFKFNQTWGQRGWNDSIEEKTRKYVEHISKHKDKIKYYARNFHEIPLLKDSMVYLDPPYMNTEAGYNAYWSKDLESKLYGYCLRQHRNGNSFMLSGVLRHDGNESELLKRLVKDGFTCIDLNYNYNKISKKGEKNTLEVIVKNY